MDHLSRFCCLNSDCPMHGKRRAVNLTVTHGYDPEKARRMLHDWDCKDRFIECKGIPPPRREMTALTTWWET